MLHFFRFCAAEGKTKYESRNFDLIKISGFLRCTGRHPSLINRSIAR